MDAVFLWGGLRRRVKKKIIHRVQQSRRKKMVQEGGAWDKEAKEEEPAVSRAILFFFNHLFDLVNLKILFCRANFRLLIMLGSLKIPIEISIPLSSGNFWVIVVHFRFKEIKFGDFTVPHNEHWYYKLPLVRSVHLVRNVHEEGPQVFKHKIGGGGLKILW